jgi:hypothetical protein
MQAVREYRRNVHPVGASGTSQHAQDFTNSANSVRDNEGEYQRGIAADFVEKNFDSLERSAQRSKWLEVVGNIAALTYKHYCGSRRVRQV